MPQPVAALNLSTGGGFLGVGRRLSLRATLLAPPVGLVYAAITASVLLSAARLFLFVRQYAENILFADQWGYYEGLLLNLDLGSLFLWETAPHRMGLGNLALRLLSNLTRWDGRAEAYEGWAALLISACLALLLKRRLVGRWHLADAFIPILVLTPMQHELLVLIPMPAVSFLPLVLLLLTALAATAADRRLRYLSLAILNGLAVYTGYGLFIGFITPLVILTEPAETPRARWGQTAALIVTVATTASFFVGYRFGLGVAQTSDCVASNPLPIERLQMLALFYNSPLGLPFLNPSAYVVTLGLLATGAWSARRAVDAADRRRFLPLAILFAFTFLVAVSVIASRVCIGVSYGQAPRYITYMIPTWLGLYIALYLLPRDFLRRTLPIGFALLAATVLMVRSSRLEPSLGVAAKKTEWKDCYRRLEDVDRCDQETAFSVIPPDARPEADALLAHFKANRLNLFNDAPGG